MKQPKKTTNKTIKKEVKKPLPKATKPVAKEVTKKETKKEPTKEVKEIKVVKKEVKTPIKKTTKVVKEVEETIQPTKQPVKKTPKKGIVPKPVNKPVKKTTIGSKVSKKLDIAEIPEEDVPIMEREGFSKTKRYKIDKYVRLAEDAHIDKFKEMSQKISDNIVQWSYYAISDGKGYHYYIVLDKI